MSDVVMLVAALLTLVATRAAVVGTAASVTATVLASGPSWTDGRAMHVTMREVTIPPGGSTGWHWHDGELIAVVKSGALTRTLADCSTVTTPAGASIVEPAGVEHVHVGRNLGAEPLVLYVTYLMPVGSPLAHDIDAPPACAP
jgi:quercetin dioxygenase-like cupin family protein